VFTKAPDGTPGTGRLTRNRRVGCGYGGCDLFSIGSRGSYEVSRSHMYAVGAPVRGLTPLKVDLTRVNSTESTPRPLSSIRAFYIIDPSSQVRQRTKSPSDPGTRFTAISGPHFLLAAPDFPTAFPTFTHTYFCGSGYPIHGRASRSWPIRYAYGLYDE
jgi:hypothetical protein